ncbi:sulfite exporter TauE/SafE family protein [Candidatus Omnitrophota bacterium]
MDNTLTALYITAATIGFMHTVFGPDHYLPFVMMKQARKWSLMKTAMLTLLCGFGHIMSSVIIGALGVIFSINVMRLEILEAFRGNLAGWALVAFGFTYFIWGLHMMLKNKPHGHFHAHADYTNHSHSHSHTSEHVHVHDGEAKKSITPWVLFTIFILGPCEPLIPILMYPAAKDSIVGVIGVTAIFGIVTIVTMLSIVIISSLGMKLIPLRRLERYTHALAGGAICLCGLAIQFFGL